MHEHPVLGRLTLGYAPLIDRRRALVATRLSVFPERPDAVPDPQALLAAVCEAFPEPTGVPDPWCDDAAAATCASRVLLSVAGEPLLQALLAAPPPPHVALEVPAFLATAPDHAAAITALHAAGRRFMSSTAADRIFRVESDGIDLCLGMPARFGAGYGLNSENMPISPNPRACFWGGWGGSLIVNDLDAELTFAYVMNRMGSGTVGDMRSAGPLMATYAAIG